MKKSKKDTKVNFSRNIVDENDINLVIDNISEAYQVKNRNLEKYDKFYTTEYISMALRYLLFHILVNLDKEAFPFLLNEVNVNLFEMDVESLLVLAEDIKNHHL